MRALSIHTTDLCNSKCVFCVVDSPSIKKDGVRKDLMLQFLEENAGKGYEAVNLHGGEATVRKDLMEILEVIQRLGYPRSILQTNGRRMANMAYAKQLYERGVDLYVVSLHCHDAASHDEATQAFGGFVETIQGIRNVKELGARVRTNTVIWKNNYTNLPDIIDLALKLGVDHINISAIHPVGMAFRNFNETVPLYSQIQPYLFESIKRVRESGRIVTLEGFPYCTIPGYEDYLIDWSNEKFKMLYRQWVMEDYENYMNDFHRRRDKRCDQCTFSAKCSGVYNEYLDAYGWVEFKPVPTVTDPVR